MCQTPDLQKREMINLWGVKATKSVVICYPVEQSWS